MSTTNTTRLCARAGCDYPAGECAGQCMRGAQLTRDGIRFAPGAIEHHTSHQRAELRRWLLRAAYLMAACAGVGLAAGLASGFVWRML